MGKRAKTLNEFDDKKLEEVSNEKVEPVKTLKRPMVCLLCTSKRVSKIVPEVKMGEKVLYECSTCNERFYK